MRRLLAVPPPAPPPTTPHGVLGCGGPLYGIPPGCSYDYSHKAPLRTPSNAAHRLPRLLPGDRLYARRLFAASTLWGHPGPYAACGALAASSDLYGACGALSEGLPALYPRWVGAWWCFLPPPGAGRAFPRSRRGGAVPVCASASDYSSLTTSMAADALPRGSLSMAGGARCCSPAPGRPRSRPGPAPPQPRGFGAR